MASSNPSTNSKATYFVALNKLGVSELSSTRLEIFIQGIKESEPTIVCDSIDQDGPFLKMAARIPGSHSSTIDVQIPHHYVLYLLGGKQKSIGFVLDEIDKRK
jgi:hypothetical protein